MQICGFFLNDCDYMKNILYAGRCILFYAGRSEVANSRSIKLLEGTNQFDTVATTLAVWVQKQPNIR